MPDSRRAGRMVVPALVGIGFAAAAILLLATPSGLGLGGDSYYYVSGARSLAAGDGFMRPAADGTTRPITHFPPAYSLVLAALIAAGGEIPAAARGLHAVLFGVSTLLVGWLILRSTDRPILALAGAVLFGFSPVMLSIHAWLLSEALFLSLTLTSLLALDRYWTSGRGAWFLLAVAGATLGVLTRYVGVALVVSLAAVLAWAPRKPGRGRWARGGWMLAIGIGGWLAWAGRNAVVAGSATNRGWAWHPPEAERALEAAATLAQWLLPGRVPVLFGEAVVLVVLLAGAAGAWRWLARRRRQPLFSGDVILAASLLFLMVYAALLMVSLTLLDASTPLDDRILAPAYAAGLIAGLGLLAPVISRGGARGWLARGAIVGLMALTLARLPSKVMQLRQDGLGYAGRWWRESELVVFVGGLDAATPIYTNELDAVYLLTGRQAYQIPIRWDPVQAAPRADYESQLDRFRESILRQGAVLVLFDSLSTQQAFFPSEEELSEGLRLVYDAGDGAVYAAP